MDAETLCAVVAGHRGRLLAAWRGQGGQAWDPVAEAYGAGGVPGREGLRVALDRVRDWALAAADGLDLDPQVRSRLARLTEDALDEIGPEHGARAGLSAIFANATASTGWWAARTPVGAVRVARCPGCGASQQRILCFVCEYCGGDLFPRRGAG